MRAVGRQDGSGLELLVMADDTSSVARAGFFDDGLFVALNDVDLSRRQVLVCRGIRPAGPPLDDHALVTQVDLFCNGPCDRIDTHVIAPTSRGTAAVGEGPSAQISLLTARRQAVTGKIGLVHPVPARGELTHHRRHRSFRQL